MTVWLATEAFRKIREEAKALHPLESGGVLLGWRSGADRVVIDVIGPGPLALHGRHMFLPDHKWQISQIHRFFEESGGDIDYLGDWHSHPDGVAEMSKTDHSTLRRIAHHVTSPLMLITAGGQDRADWMVKCWRGQLKRRFIFSTFDALPEETRSFDPPGEWRLHSGSTIETAA